MLISDDELGWMNTGEHRGCVMEAKRILFEQISDGSWIIFDLLFVKELRSNIRTGESFGFCSVFLQIFSYLKLKWRENQTQSGNDCSEMQDAEVERRNYRDDMFPSEDTYVEAQ